jgi:Ser/Thr protein kinase RdoA (MazF antagonist)
MRTQRGPSGRVDPPRPVGCRPWSVRRGRRTLERRPDVDGEALQALLRRLIGPGLTVARTPEGVAAQVYRVEVAGRVVYVRIAEESHEDLSVERSL